MLPLSFRRRAEMLATSERTKLALGPTDRLDPQTLAAAYGINVVELSKLPGPTAAQRARLMEQESKDLSALLVVDESGQAMIIVNDSHTPQRQASSVCHEMGHLLLGHAAGPILDAAGSRVYPERQENEATWFAGALLVPVKGLRMLYPKRTRPEIEQHYGVSQEMLRWRCNMHGMAKVAA